MPVANTIALIARPNTENPIASIKHSFVLHSGFSMAATGRRRDKLVKRTTHNNARPEMASWLCVLAQNAPARWRGLFNQSSDSSTSRRVPINWSIWAFSMISGGLMAMMSPVVRIRMPFS